MPFRKFLTLFRAVRKQRSAKRKNAEKYVKGKQIRVARIGLGRRGAVLDDAILEIDDILVRGAYDKNPSSMEKYCDLGKLLEKTDEEDAASTSRNHGGMNEGQSK